MWTMCGESCSTHERMQKQRIAQYRHRLEQECECSWTILTMTRMYLVWLKENHGIVEVRRDLWKSSCTTPLHRWKEPGHILFVPLRVPMKIDSISLEPFLPLAEQSHLSQPFPILEMLQSHHYLCQTLSSSSLTLLHWGAQNWPQHSRCGLTSRRGGKNKQNSLPGSSSMGKKEVLSMGDAYPYGSVPNFSKSNPMTRFHSRWIFKLYKENVKSLNLKMSFYTRDFKWHQATSIFFQKAMQLSAIQIWMDAAILLTYSKQMKVLME